MNIPLHKDKEIIVFDLDCTLTLSKQPLEKDISDLLCKLLSQKKVAVISGASYEQFKKQFVSNLVCDDQSLENLFLFPTSATSFYKFQNGEWSIVYEEGMTSEEKAKIFEAFQESFSEVGFDKPQQTFGKIIEDRGSQITFSALGQDAPLELKKEWDPDGAKRGKIIKALSVRIPEFEIRYGGMTSIDVTKKGVDKAYGLGQIEKNLSIPISKMVFVGDSLSPGGNDHAVIKTGVEVVSVSGPEEVKTIINSLLTN